MATYKESGVDIDLGDKCSAIAYAAAKATFPGRKGMIGEPVIEEGGFTGAMDMGDYLLVQNDDGIGTKMEVAELMGKYDTIGYDLVAMVADDASCVGAETISVSNTIDANKVDEKKITAMMEGLKKAATEHKIIVPGGEIAELGDVLNGYIWNATAVGVVEKNRIITGKNIKPGDKVIGLGCNGFRANGLSLVRYVLRQKFGENWAHEKYDETRTWGEVALIPSVIYTSLIMDLHGRFKEKPKAEIKGIAHITGGGIAGNFGRVLKKTGLGANLDNLPTPHEQMLKLIEIGGIPKEDAYRTWNMGVGMILVSNDVEVITEACARHNVRMQVIGEIVEGGKITIKGL